MKKLLLLTLLLFPATGFADSVAIATSTIDWRGFSYTVTGNYVVQPSPYYAAYINGNGTVEGGFMQSVSDVHSADGYSSREYISAGLLYGFGMRGTGAGSVTVTAPYIMTANCMNDPGAEGDGSSAYASATLSVGGGGAGEGQFVKMDCREGGSKQGIFTVTSEFFFSEGPTWLPTFSISANTVADSYAKAPEPSSLMLLPLGLIGIVAARRRQNQIVS
jgi:hypothetical protein